MAELTGYIDWTAPDGSLLIRLAEPVISRMNIDVMRGFGVTRRRGTEVGGLLIGRVQKGSPLTILIDDFEQAPCEYAYGPSYLLSSNDEVHFSDAVNRWRPAPGRDTYAVGYYRSHTRDGLGIDAPDAELFTRFFSEGTAVALLVKPFATRHPVASFFVPVRGRLKVDAPAVEFPFSTSVAHEAEEQPAPPPSAPVRVPSPTPSPAGEVAKPAPTPVAAATAVPEEPVTVQPPPRRPSEADRILIDVLGPRQDFEADEPERDEYGRPLFSQYSPRPTPRWKTRLAWLVFTLAVFACGGVLGYQYAGGTTASWLAFGAAIPARDPYALGVSAVVRGDSVVVQWNRYAAAVQAARAARMIVTEAAGTKEIQLSQPEVRSGVVLYRTAASEARFRLELDLGNSRTVAEAVDWRQP